LPKTGKNVKWATAKRLAISAKSLYIDFMHRYGLFLTGLLVLLLSCNPSGRGIQTHSGLDDPAYKKLKAVYDTDKLKDILQSARESIFRVWADGELPALPPSGANEGLAVRLIVKGKDRGCLSWYKNSGDMKLFAAFCAAQALRDPRYEPLRPEEAGDTLLELVIFGEWEEMANPGDFIPGLHNLWLADGPENTILQASLVPQRHYTKEAFLQTICIKAGLAKNAWKENKTLLWRRSPAIWLTESLQ
jgi:AMMECR1 domain-containing protein